MKWHILVFSLLMLALGIFIGIGMENRTVTVYQETQTIRKFSYDPLLQTKDYSVATIPVPAVDENGNGVTTILTVQASPGEGRVLANIDKILFWTDTQNSIRTSKKVAENITGINLSFYDVVYTIETDAAAVEGPSAGAALAVATVAALERKEIRKDVMITGSLNHDGSIGPVGNVLEKAKAAKESGATIFLVPLSLSDQVSYEEAEHCEQIGSSELCTKERIPHRFSIEEEAGIEVIEVKNVDEALGYFFS